MKSQVLQSVLLVTPWYRPFVGGVVETVARLADGLARNGIKVGVLTQGDCEEITPVSNDNGVGVWKLNLRTTQAERFRPRMVAGYMARFAGTREKLGNFIEEHRFQVVNVHYPGSEFYYFAQRKNPPEYRLVVSVHGSDMRVEIHQGWLHGRLTRKLLLTSDAVVACSRGLLRLTDEVLRGRLKDKGHVIYGGVPDEWVTEEAVGTDERDPNSILLVGSLREVKGIDIGLRAFARVRRQHPRAHLTIAGDGPLRESLVNLAQELGVEESVTFLGAIPQEELRHYYRNASFVMMPSRSEGFPLVALEAMAFGTPIVATSVGGLPELITDNVNGVLVPPEDVEAFYHGMLRLLEHPEQARQLGTNGRRDIARRFTWGHNTQAYKELFTELICS